MNIDQIEAIKQQQEEQGKLLKVLGPFNEEMRKLKSAFAGIQTEFLSTITPGISGIANFLTGDFKDTLVGLGKFMIENPKTTAAAFLAGLGGSMLFDFAKQVSIVYTGTKMALGGFPLFSKGLAMAGKGIGVGAGVGGALLGGEIADRSDSMIGKGAGIATSAASGALIGSMIPIVGTALGAVLGGAYGAFRASDLDTKLMDFLSGGSRNLGTMGAIGQTFEPKTSMLKVHAGERVLNQNETARYNQEQSVSQTNNNSALNQLNEIMKEVNKSLNTGNMIAAMIEKNTKSTKNTLARAEGNLV